MHLLKQTLMKKCTWRSRRCTPKSCSNVVFKLVKSLYGLGQAPRTFSENLRDGLLERSNTQSQNGILGIVYVDDTIFDGADPAILENEIRALRVSETEQCQSFQLCNEGEDGAFLGIQITKSGQLTCLLLKTGLISKVLTTAGMPGCNRVFTATGNSPIDSGADGTPSPNPCSAVLSLVC